MTEFHAHYELRAEIHDRVGSTSAADAARRLPTAHVLLQRAGADLAGATTALIDPELVLLAVTPDFEAAEHDPAALAEPPRVMSHESLRRRRMRRMAERRREAPTPERRVSHGTQYLWSARQRVVARFGLLIIAPTRELAEARAEDARLAVLAALPGCLADLHVPQANAGSPILELWSPHASASDAALPAPLALPAIPSDRPRDRAPGLRRHLVEYHIDLHCLTLQQGADADDARERALAELEARGYPLDDDVHGVTLTIDCAEEEPEPRASATDPGPRTRPGRVLAGLAGEWSHMTDDDEDELDEVMAFHRAVRHATVAEIVGEADPAEPDAEPVVPPALPAGAPTFEIAFLTHVYYCGYVWASDEEHAHLVVAEDIDARAEDGNLDQPDHDLEGVEFEVVHVGPHKPRRART